MTSISWPARLALLGVAGAVVALWYWSDRDERAAARFSIETVPVDRGDIVRSVATTGSVRALVTVEVGSQLSGQVAEIFADFNTPVARNQLIARIDPATFETRVRQAEADLEVASASVVVQKAAILRAEANSRLAEREYERQKPLGARGAISETSLDTAQAAFEAARAELEMARAQLVNAEAVVAQRRAALADARIDLERTRIKSPIDGVVIERSVSVGQTVAASLAAPTLFKIAQDLRALQIEADVDEADIGQVATGDPVTFTVDAYPEEEFPGVVEQVRLSPVELDNVVTYTVVIAATNEQMKLLPGMTASVEIITGRRENVLRVANDALRFRPPSTPESEAGEAAVRPRPDGAWRAMLEGDLRRIGVSGDAIASILDTLRQDFAALRAENPAVENGREGLRVEIRQRRDAVMQRFLSAEQLAAWHALERSRGAPRRGEIWIREGSSGWDRRTVSLGLSDDRYTEILDGDIEAGAAAITGVREPRS
jgi:HlyD family secretion protein